MQTISHNRNAAGSGTIRKKVVKSNEKKYTYWEGRITEGFDPVTGKQKQRSFTGKTQKEVAQKLREYTAEIDNGTYLEPSKVTVGEWLTTWQTTYLNDIKPRTVEIYSSVIRNHLKPGLGGVRLQALTTPVVQAFYNDCAKKLSGKSMRNIHCVLHRSLQQAVTIGYLRFNPCDACTLPRIQKKDLEPLNDFQISDLLREIKGSPYENIMQVALFTGMREGEVLGLQWDCVDFIRGTILVKRQLQYYRNGVGYQLVPTKNSKLRSITPAKYVMQLLHNERTAQRKAREEAGDAWEETGYVFTNALGQHLNTWDVYRAFKRVATAIGRPDARFHDLRHSYAVSSIRAGDDIKTVQGNLGHATAAFTLDVYGHVTDQMKEASAARMDSFISAITDL